LNDRRMVTAPRNDRGLRRVGTALCH